MSSATSIADPLLALRKRTDLVFSEQWLSGRHHWVVKDPVTMKYYYLGDEDYAILQMLDGHTTSEQLCQRYEKQFAPKQLSKQWLQAILQRFHEDSLIISTAGNQADQLLIRRDKQRWQHVVQTTTSLLSIRFRGVDPERFLRWFYPKCKWLFSLPIMLLFVMLISSALFWVVVHLPEMAARLPSMEQYFTGNSLLWLMVTLAAVKVLHELGHLLACKHFGGESHELGLMLLVFMPCLYCDVSDSWLLPSRWRRIAIAAGGMFVELVLAAACTWLWWFSLPGAFNSFCLHVMVVCSVSTVLFNGNPLLKYDGYYIFSDFIGIPNLAQKSQKWMFATLSRCCLGITIDAHEKQQRTTIIATYAIASFAYRMFVLVAIFLILYRALQPHGLQSIAYLIIGTTLTTMFFSLFGGIKQMVNHQSYQQQFKPVRLITTLGVVAAILLGVFLIPLPQSVTAPAVLTAKDAKLVFVKVPGNLQQIAPVGKFVKQDQQIALLDDWNLKLEVARLQTTKASKQAQLTALEEQRLENPIADQKYSSILAELESVKKSLAKLQQEQATLKITAPISGTILPPIRKNDSQSEAVTGMLSSWHGTPFERRNQGCYLESGRILCQIGDPTKLEAMLIINQNDIQLVRQDQTVQIQLLQDPDNVIEGKLLEISEINLDDVHPMLAANNEIAMTTDAQGKKRPRNSSYLARVELTKSDATLLLRARGNAKIATDWQPLGTQIFRWVSRTFRFSS